MLCLQDLFMGVNLFVKVLFIMILINYGICERI